IQLLQEFTPKHTEFTPKHTEFTPKHTTESKLLDSPKRTTVEKIVSLNGNAYKITYDRKHSQQSYPIFIVDESQTQGMNLLLILSGKNHEDVHTAETCNYETAEIMLPVVKIGLQG